MLHLFNHLQRILYFSVIAMVLIGCKPAIIPEQDMVKILAKVFLVDAAVSSPHLAGIYHRKDSIEYYYEIYGPMGYTQEQFYASMEYYVRNPSKLDKILDRVVNELSRQETEIGAELNISRQKQEEERRLNLWPKPKKQWDLPKDGNQTTVDYKVDLKGIGEYIITVDVVVFPEDQSLNPALASWFYHDNGTPEGAIIGKKSYAYQKDGVSRTITQININADTLSTHLMGNLMHHDPKPGEWKKKSTIKNISVAFNPLPLVIPLPKTMTERKAEPIPIDEFPRQKGNVKDKLKHENPN